ncbi:MAG TPA: VOC family protein [Capsulimonadaceae bacterium]|nr:VOC family protein [Capsulimonadaceae bacterium]
MLRYPFQIDHFVLTVRDIKATCAFYDKVFGIAAVGFGPGRIALRIGDQKINLHEAGKEFEPKAAFPLRAPAISAS